MDIPSILKMLLMMNICQFCMIHRYQQSLVLIAKNTFQQRNPDTHFPSLQLLL